MCLLIIIYRLYFWIVDQSLTVLRSFYWMSQTCWKLAELRWVSVYLCVSLYAYSSTPTDLCLWCFTFSILIYTLGAKIHLGKTETGDWKWPHTSINPLCCGQAYCLIPFKNVSQNGHPQRKNRNVVLSDRLFSPLNFIKYFFCFLLLRSSHCHVYLLRSRCFSPYQNEKISTDHIHRKTCSSNNAKIGGGCGGTHTWEGTGLMINAVLHIDNNLLSLGSKLMTENAYSGNRGKCYRI